MSDDYPQSFTTGDVDLEYFTDADHTDVAILWGLGMKNRAHHIAQKLRLREATVYVSLSDAGDDGDEELSRIRDKWKRFK